jgi:dTDP-glucose 4,6-dehydratase
MPLPKPVSPEDLDLILAETAPLWEEARGRRIFITGGTGFFGCWLVESFCHINRRLALDAQAVLVTRNPDAFARKCPHLASDRAVSLLRGDVRSFNFPSGEFAFVIHAATEASPKRAAEKPLEMFFNIVAGTERTLQFAAAHGVEKFLLTSSGAVYGKQPASMTHVPETYLGGPDPLDPISVYAEGKRASELLCSLYGIAGPLQCKIARCWAFCGPHLPLDQHFAIGNFIADALAGRPIRISGDGTPRRSYLYAADLAVWLWTILFKAPALVPFNVGSDRDVSIRELAQIVGSTLKSEAGIQIAQEPLPGASPSRYVPSVRHANQLLGLRETVPLEEALRRTAAWCMSPGKLGSSGSSYS